MLKQKNDVQICIRLPQPVHARLMAYSSRYNMSVSQIIRMALALWFIRKDNSHED